MKNKAKTLALIGALFLAALGGNLSAQTGIKISAMPALNVPLGLENFKLGFGASAALEWGFYTLPEKVSRKKITLGAYLTGGFASLNITDGTTFLLFEGAAGPFIDFRLADRFSLGIYGDAGIYRYNWEGDSGMRLRAGASLAGTFHITPVVSLFASGGYAWYGLAASKPLHDIKVGAGVKINLSELFRPRARVEGEKTAQSLIFPVSYAWYESNEAAEAAIVNKEPNAITDVALSFFMERYMNEPTRFAVIPRLAAGETIAVPVTALFNEAMLGLTENTVANAVVRVDYRSLGSKKQAEFDAPMPVYHRNAMTWDDDRRAASFVSARDPAAVYFARYVESAVRKEIAAEAENPGALKVAAALALFEALDAYGVNYVIDPASSYSELSESGTALDSLNYPYQTLFYRAGDCDDLSILYCSLLETLGVSTAFITIPGHIYMAFDAGSADAPIAETAWTSRLIEYGGRLWAPVEITVPRLGFADAWRIGAREWNGAPPEERKLYPMADSWKIYPPVSVPGAADNLPAMPEESEIRQRFADAMKKLK